MTQKRFHQLLALYGLTFIAGCIANFWPGALSRELTVAYESDPAPVLFEYPLLCIGLVAVLGPSVLAGYVGLFFFCAWARWLSLATTLAGCVLLFFAGPALMSAAASALFEIASMLWGAVLAMAYTAPLSARFGASHTVAGAVTVP